MVKTIGCLIVRLIFNQTLNVVNLKQSYLNDYVFCFFNVKDYFRKLRSIADICGAIIAKIKAFKIRSFYRYPVVTSAGICFNCRVPDGSDISLHIMNSRGAERPTVAHRHCSSKQPS